MIARLIRTCLEARFWVLLGGCGLLVAGVVSAHRAPIDAFPEFAPPRVEVQTEAPGLSSLEVENLVTIPLENTLAGISFVQTVRSKSVLGLSSIVLLFESGTDLFIARQLVQERLGRATAQLPATAKAPVMMAPVSSTGRILKIGLTSKSLSQVEMTDLVKWTLRPRLLAVPGVANVAVWGARERQYDVRLDPILLDAANLTSDDVAKSLQASTTPVAGGYVDGPVQRLSVQHASTIERPEDLEKLAVTARAGAPIRLRDVGTVIDSFPQPIGDAVVNDQLGLLLIVEKQPWGNTLEVTERIDQVLTEMRPAMAGIEVDASIFRPASFIAKAIANLKSAIFIGSIFVVIVLLVFLWNWRTAVISILAIPLSLAAAMIVLRTIGGTLNTMVLAGLVIALGEIVDDAIIDVENILRRLHQNRLSDSPRPALEVALHASLEVRSAVVYATIIVILVFLPVCFLEGVSGAFFRPLALSYGLGVLASMVVALTVTPALSLILLPSNLAHDKPAPVMSRLACGYERLLGRLVNRGDRVLGCGVVAMGVGALGFFTLGDAFLPEFRENDFLMHWVAQPGTSLTALTRTTLKVSRELRAIPGIHSFGAHLGRAEAADEIVGANFAELWVHADEHTDHEAVAHQIHSIIERYPGLRRDLETYLRERVEEVVSGTPGAIVVRIAGPDLAELRRSADALAVRIRTLSGVGDVQVEQQGLVPELSIIPEPEAAAAGFLPGDIRRTISLWVKGERVGEVFRNGQAIPIVVRGLDLLREDPVSLREALLISPSGARARLKDIATVAISPTPNTIQHEAGSRRIDVSVKVKGDLGKAAGQVSELVMNTKFPVQHHATVLGEWKERKAAQRRLLWLSCLSLALVLLVLYADLKSARKMIMVAVSLPFALVGGVAGAWLAGGILSLGSLVGLVTVLGIAARNGILLISHYGQLETEGVSGLEIVRRGSTERIGPIMMTALATGLALVPLVITGNQPGHEIEHPMAVVILGGLVSSTVLNLLIVPVLYHRYGNTKTAPSVNSSTL